MSHGTSIGTRLKWSSLHDTQHVGRRCKITVAQINHEPLDRPLLASAFIHGDLTPDALKLAGHDVFALVSRLSLVHVHVSLRFELGRLIQKRRHSACSRTCWLPALSRSAPSAPH